MDREEVPEIRRALAKRRAELAAHEGEQAEEAARRDRANRGETIPTIVHTTDGTRTMNHGDL